MFSSLLQHKPEQCPHCPGVKPFPWLTSADVVGVWSVPGVPGCPHPPAHLWAQARLEQPLPWEVVLYPEPEPAAGTE